MPKQSMTKQLNPNVPGYKQKLQFSKDLKKTKEGEKIKPKEIFESKKTKRVQKKKY